MSEFTIERCKSCNAEIIWATTTQARSMPIDAKPRPGGNIALDHRPGLPPLARVLTVTQQFGRKTMYTSHFATCPNAKKHRRRDRP